MRCNTPLMNSWHSFSPNGRWLVFSSKMHSPYTPDVPHPHRTETGNDSPPILIENSTAANRAVNIPEFVNIPQDGLEQIEVPAGDYYRQFDIAAELAKKDQYEAAIPEWKKALELNSGEARAHVGLGVAYARTGRDDDAAASFRNAQQAEPDKWESYGELGVLLARQGRFDDAVTNLERANQLNPATTPAWPAIFAAHSRSAAAEPRTPSRFAAKHWRSCLTTLPPTLIWQSRCSTPTASTKPSRISRRPRN